MDLKPEQRGALVEDVAPGGPADNAGLRGSDRQVTLDGQEARVAGDVIVAIEGSPVNTMDDLISYLTDRTTVGQKINLSILRDGKEKSLEVSLEARPTQTEQATTTASDAWLGIQGIPLTPGVDQAMNLEVDQQVESGSPADLASLRGSYKPVIINGEAILVGGDVITAVDAQEIFSPDELSAILSQSEPGQEVSLTILRDGEFIQRTVTLAERPEETP
jgi:2-alkenal reductase